MVRGPAIILRVGSNLVSDTYCLANVGYTLPISKPKRSGSGAVSQTPDQIYALIKAASAIALP